MWRGVQSVGLYSQGTPGVLQEYSRGTDGVLQGWSQGALQLMERDSRTLVDGVARGGVRVAERVEERFESVQQKD